MGESVSGRWSRNRDGCSPWAGARSCGAHLGGFENRSFACVCECALRSYTRCQTVEEIVDLSCLLRSAEEMGAGQSVRSVGDSGVESRNLSRDYRVDGGGRRQSVCERAAANDAIARQQLEVGNEEKEIQCRL